MIGKEEEEDNIGVEGGVRGIILQMNETEREGRTGSEVVILREICMDI